MSILEELNRVIQFHDEYAAIRYEERRPVELVNMFHSWHGQAAMLFSRYIPVIDLDLQKFKDVKNGNCYVLASSFGNIETSFSVLVDKLKNSVYVKLEQLISEGEDIAASIEYEEPAPYEYHTFDVYYIKKDTEFQLWKNRCLRLLEVNFRSDGSLVLFKDALNAFEKNDYDPKYMIDMIGVLKACVEIPNVKSEISDKAIGESTSPITINLNQNQTQTQVIALDIFLESIRDEIPGKHFKELKAIAKEEPNPEKAKSKILDKVKSFGSDVLSNIVANIITNPDVWSGLL